MAVVAITCADETLGIAAVAVPAPVSDEGGEVSIRLAQGDAVVAVPCISYGFVRVLRDQARCLEGVVVTHSSLWQCLFNG